MCIPYFHKQLIIIVVLYFLDMLLYVSDGVLPFLRVFFSKMSESVSEECVADIYKALLVCIVN